MRFLPLLLLTISLFVLGGCNEDSNSSNSTESSTIDSETGVIPESTDPTELPSSGEPTTPPPSTL